MIEPLGFLDGSGGLAFEASGTSMLPGIRDGDRLTVLPVESLSIGDIVVVRRAEELVCHRVQELRADGSVVTRGDGVTADDPPISRAKVLGKVVARRPRRLVRWRAPAARLFRRLTGSAAARRALRLVLPLLCRYSVAVPAPLESIPSYRFHALDDPRAREGLNAPGALLVARLAGRVVARLAVSSGSLEVHEALSGLGLERALLRRL